MTNKEIIYVNGCSFTGGTDIADELYEQYPGHISLDYAINTTGHPEAFDRSRQYFNWKQTLVANDPDGHILEEEKKLRWSNVLSNILGIDVINNSCAGTDNQSMIIRTCNDIAKLQRQGHVIKKIIIQFTCRTRFSYVRSWDSNSWDINKSYIYAIDKRNKEKITLDDEFYMRYINHGLIDGDYINPYENIFLKSYNPCILYEKQSEGSQFLNYLLQLKIYKNAIMGSTGIEPIFVDSWFLKLFGCQIVENDVRLYNSSIDSKSIIDRTIAELFPEGFSSMIDICLRDDLVMTPGYHFNSTVHKKFAEHLSERYFK